MFWNSIISSFPGYGDAGIQESVKLSFSWDNGDLAYTAVWSVWDVVDFWFLKRGWSSWKLLSSGEESFVLGDESRIPGEDFLWIKWLKITHQWQLGSIVGAEGSLFDSYIIVWSCALLLHPFLGMIATSLVHIEVPVICDLERFWFFLPVHQTQDESLASICKLNCFCNKFSPNFPQRTA